LSIGDVLYTVILGNVFFADEVDGIGAFYSAAYAVCESSKFSGWRLGPIVVISRVAEESVIVEKFACVFVHDCKGTMYFIVDALHLFGQDGNGFKNAQSLLGSVCGRGGMKFGFGSSV